MEEFTAEQIKRASNRVREMQRRSAFPTPANEIKSTAKIGLEDNPHHSDSAEFDRRNTPSASPFSRFFKFIDFNNFEFDNDSRLILGILLLLTSSGADELLILALIYVML